MALRDLFKKRKGEKETVKKSEEKLEKPLKKEILVSIPKSKKRTGAVYGIVKEPHISEKGSVLAEKGQYIFKVFPNANKTEIKKAIEGIYRVDVLSVNVLKIPAKKRRLGKISGFKKGYKKAIVKIKPGQKIEIL